MGAGEREGGLRATRSLGSVRGRDERNRCIDAGDDVGGAHRRAGGDRELGGVAFVLGGPVRGGVVADWPGLGRDKRFEGRDLRATTDLRAILKGVLGDHLQVPSRVLERDVFPDSANVRPLALLRA